MNYAFEHHLEAQRYADITPSLTARAALRGIHTLILECAGGNLHFLPDRFQPIQTLDVLFFYKVVARLFAEWTEEIRDLPEASGNRECVLQLQEAKDLIPTLPTQRAQVGLANFISILLATPVPRGTFIDALFCCRLVSVLLSDLESLESILRGEAEEVITWYD
jgi:hypothetical protein